METALVQQISAFTDVDFELALAGARDGVDPIEMVARDGYFYPDRWQHAVSGAPAQIGMFRLVETRQDFENLYRVQMELTKKWDIPSGIWREPLRSKLPMDVRVMVGVPDPSWVDSNGFCRFPMIMPDGKTRFYWADQPIKATDRWYWLVKSKS